MVAYKRSVVETRNSPHVDSTSGVDVFLISQCILRNICQKKISGGGLEAA